MNRYVPDWLNDTHPATKALLSFLQIHRASIRDLRVEAISTQDFEFEGPLAFSSFSASKDSYAYANLIAEGLKLPSIDRIVDLGVGSALPLVSALLQTNRPVAVVGFDVDARALETAKRNLEVAGLDAQSKLIEASITSFLQSADLDTALTTLIASNPPYLPCPPNLEAQCRPVDGGADGTRFLEQLLTHRFRGGQLLALQWGSVSNPTKIIGLIQESYDVVYASAVEVDLGKYSSRADVNRYLNTLRAAGQCALSDPADGKQRQLIIGTILRKRP